MRVNLYKFFALLKFRGKRKLAFNIIDVLGFVPSNIGYYEVAFVHKSASLSLPDGSIVNNERLEYLGDAVLSAVIAQFLFSEFPDGNEGYLTEMRAKIVKRSTLNLVANSMGMSRLVVSNVNQGRCKNFLGDALEALIGALFIDKGFKFTRKFIVHTIIRKYINIEKLDKKVINYKSKVIEWGQKNKEDIVFEIQEKPHFNGKGVIFTSNLKMNNIIIGSGWGNSKKEAEQKAAEEGMYYIEQSL